ncbi:MAG: hypothetical protein AB1894_00695 [Chloroflexota bacterium]
MRPVTISARPKELNPKKRFLQDVTVELGADMEKDFDVEEEDFPDDLPARGRAPGTTVTWVSNFKLVKLTKAAHEMKKKKYTIKLEYRPGQLVYWDGANIQPLTASRAGKNQVQAELEIQDPPVGWET